MTELDVDELRSCYKYAIDNRDSKDAIERGKRFDRWLSTIQPNPDDPAMVERVARELWPRMWAITPTQKWTDISDDMRAPARIVARAVLAVIAGGK